MPMKSLQTIAVSLLFTFGVPLAVTADNMRSEDVSRLLKNGEIQSLFSTLEIVRPITGTHILEVIFENGVFGMAYEIYFLDTEGRRREIYVDARTGEILMQRLDN